MSEDSSAIQLIKALQKEARQDSDEITRLREERDAAIQELEETKAILPQREPSDVLCRPPFISDWWGVAILERRNRRKAEKELAAAIAERDSLREALKPFANAASTDDYIDDVEIAETDTARKITFGDLRCARAALDGTEPASPWRDIESAPKDGTMVLVWDESSSPEVVAAYFEDDKWVYGDQLLAAADWEGPQPTHWMSLPTPPR